MLTQFYAKHDMSIPDHGPIVWIVNVKKDIACDKSKIGQAPNTDRPWYNLKRFPLNFLDNNTHIQDTIDKIEHELVTNKDINSAYTEFVTLIEKEMKDTVPVLKTPTGPSSNKSSDVDAVLDKWKTDYEKLFNSGDNGNFDNNHLGWVKGNNRVFPTRNCDTLNCPVTRQDVIDAVNRTKLNKAVGFDYIPAESLRNSVCIDLLFKLISFCFQNGDALLKVEDFKLWNRLKCDNTNNICKKVHTWAIRRKSSWDYRVLQLARKYSLIQNVEEVIVKPGEVRMKSSQHINIGFLPLTYIPLLCCKQLLCLDVPLELLINLNENLVGLILPTIRMPKRKRGSKLTKGVKRKRKPLPWPAVDPIMEEISVAVSNHTDDAKDEPCLNQDTSILKFVHFEEITIASAKDKGELLLVELEDHTYASKEQPSESENTCRPEFDCQEDFFLAPAEGTEQQITQEIEIFAVNETQTERAELCLSPFQTLCGLLEVSISDPELYR
ncbi:unnamed protein product [Mytilus coruscus]|uniref:Uncharacterized protein n=1 Tax=Mytilus coruscus TaxID=42192 RepID=A0A6J8DJ41_MYTCO|nr:unnamed protein product [Mytilus coruscus]